MMVGIQTFLTGHSSQPLLSFGFERRGDQLMQVVETKACTSQKRPRFNHLRESLGNIVSR